MLSLSLVLAEYAAPMHQMSQNTCPLGGICVVELFLPVGGAVDHQIEKMPTIEVRGFYFKQLRG